jgi:hypothetical protein
MSTRFGLFGHRAVLRGGVSVKRIFMRTSSKRGAPSRQAKSRKPPSRKIAQKRPRSESTKQDYRFFPEAVALAAERVGNSGRDGLLGYLVWLARTQPRLFGTLLARTASDAVIGEKPLGRSELEIRIFGPDGAHARTVRDGVLVYPAENGGAPMSPTPTTASPHGAALLRGGNGHKTLRRGKGQRTRRSSESTRQEYGSLLEAVLLAAEQVGEDNHGRDGLVGYLVRLARIEPIFFATLLARVPLHAIVGEKESEPILMEINVFDKALKDRRREHEEAEPSCSR